MEHADWYHFGGIARGAELHRLPGTWIESLRLITEDVREGRFSLRLDYRSESAAAVPLIVECDGRILAEETLAIAAHLEREGLSDKPLIISEIGAGAVPGWRDAHHGMWTEEYQSEPLATAGGHVLGDRDRFAGIAIWLLGDFRTTGHEEMLLGRPRSANDKGVLDEYRRPRQAYRTVRELFHGA